MQGVGAIRISPAGGIHRQGAGDAATVKPSQLSTIGFQGVDESLGISESGLHARACRAAKFFSFAFVGKPWGVGISGSWSMLSL